MSPCFCLVVFLMPSAKHANLLWDSNKVEEKHLLNTQIHRPLGHTRYSIFRTDFTTKRTASL